MRLRFCLGAALLSAFAALTAGPALAQDRRPAGKVCLENAGGFVIGAKFSFLSDESFPPRRTVDVGYYPIMQTRCTDFYEGESFADIDVAVVAGIGKQCRVMLDRNHGKTITARIQGTTLVADLKCPS